ncbi:hypothetical protein EV702DRAFT_1043200 [Suillus placidus]|uniref:Uncharacterized protein n=1 Tax=Suillus placidus TaxID=48579 RepID=A0A9P7A248_9AGAM|nr:hypothetical protein EV702DRAFT_1043200 [Suillus placidus]
MPQLLSLALLQLLHQAPLLALVVRPTREQSQTIQRDAMGMDLDQSAPEDELYNDDNLYWQGDYADDLPDPPAGYKNQPATPLLPDPLQHKDSPIPPPEPHPGDKNQPAPEPNLPAAHKDQHTIEDINLDEIQCLANVVAIMKTYYNPSHLFKPFNTQL